MDYRVGYKGKLEIALYFVERQKSFDSVIKHGVAILDSEPKPTPM